MILYLLTKELNYQKDLTELLRLIQTNDFLLCLGSAKNILVDQTLLKHCQIGILENEADNLIAKQVKRLTEIEWIDLSLSAEKVIHWNLGL